MPKGATWKIYLLEIPESFKFINAFLQFENDFWVIKPFFPFFCEPGSWSSRPSKTDSDWETLIFNLLFDDILVWCYLGSGAGCDLYWAGAGSVPPAGGGLRGGAQSCPEVALLLRLPGAVLWIRIRTESVFRSFVDPDPYSRFGSWSTLGCIDFFTLKTRLIQYCEITSEPQFQTMTP